MCFWTLYILKVLALGPLWQCHSAYAYEFVQVTNFLIKKSVKLYKQGVVPIHQMKTKVRDPLLLFKPKGALWQMQIKPSFSGIA